MQEKKEIYTKEEVLANQIRIYKEHIAKLNKKIEDLECKVERQYRRLLEVKFSLQEVLNEL